MSTLNLSNYSHIEFLEKKQLGEIHSFYLNIFGSLFIVILFFSLIHRLKKINIK